LQENLITREGFMTVEDSIVLRNILEEQYNEQKENMIEQLHKPLHKSVCIISASGKKVNLIVSWKHKRICQEKEWVMIICWHTYGIASSKSDKYAAKLLTANECNILTNTLRSVNYKQNEWTKYYPKYIYTALPGVKRRD